MWINALFWLMSNGPFDNVGAGLLAVAKGPKGPKLQTQGAAGITDSSTALGRKNTVPAPLSDTYAVLSKFKK